MSCGIIVRDLKKSFYTGGAWSPGFMRSPNTVRAAKTVEAVRGVSFELGHGDVFGLIGPSGCGKTTIAKTLARLITPDSGTAEVRGRLGFVSQDPYSSLSPVLRVSSIVAEPLFFGRLAGRSGDCSGLVRRALAQVRLDYDVYKDRLPSELSGGERQRVAIARALIGDVGVLILDEPASMVDYDVKLEITDILRQLAKNHDYAILLISHDIGFVRDVCTYIAVMESGQIIEEGAPTEICESPQHEQTRKLVLASLDLKAYLAET